MDDLRENDILNLWLRADRLDVAEVRNLLDHVRALQEQAADFDPEDLIEQVKAAEEERDEIREERDTFDAALIAANARIFGMEME